MTFGTLSLRFEMTQRRARLIIRLALIILPVYLVGLGVYRALMWIGGV